MKYFFRLAFFSCIIFASHSLHAQKSPQWFLQAIIPEDSLQGGYIYFSDSLHGYFIGRKLLNATEKIYTASISTYKEAPFYRTVDGGVTWTKINYASVYGNDLPNFDTTFDVNNPDQTDGWCYDINFAAIPNTSTCIISNMDGLVDCFPDTLRFYSSNDYGTDWYRSQTIPFTKRSTFAWKAVTNESGIIAMQVEDTANSKIYNTGKFVFSHDGGITFNDFRWDSTLLNNIRTHVDSTNNLLANVFDYFNDSTWIVIMRDTDLVSAATSYKLVTLLSTDAGHSWQRFNNIIPNIPPFYSTIVEYSIQCIRGTPYVYLFNITTVPYGLYPLYGVNYIYSSDYGKTWGVDTAFSKNRKAYFASAPGEIWCTATAHDSAFVNKPAHWITHTKDFGKTWSIDSVSLFNDGYYDGIDLAFPDPQHGWLYAQTDDHHISAIFKYRAPKDEVKPEIYIFKQFAAGRYDNSIFYKVYPNPANTETTIQLNFGLQMTGIECFDILGRRRNCPAKISEDQTSATIQTNSLTSGCYLVHVTLENTNYIVPIMVQH